MDAEHSVGGIPAVERDWLPLAVGAFRLRQTHWRTLRDVRRGHLEGQLLGGRWFVSAQSVEQLVASRRDRETPESVAAELRSQPA